MSNLMPYTYIYTPASELWRIHIMATFKKYTNKKGEFWLFKAYLGIDPMTGKEKRTTRRGFKTQKAAKIAYDRLLNDIQENGFAQTKAPETFRDVYKLWHEEFVDTVKSSSVEVITSIFNNNILPVFGDLRLNKISVVFCQQAVNTWSKEFATASRMRMLTSTIFKYAMKLEYTERNPMELVTMPHNRKQSQGSGDNFYSKDELRVFLSYLDRNTLPYYFFRVLAYTGMRKGELLALQWSDIDAKTNQITINKTVSRGKKQKIETPKTKNSNRIISVDQSTIDTLKRWKLLQRTIMLRHGFNTNNNHQLVFSAPRSNGLILTSIPIKWINQVHKAHPKLKRITVHGFRHTCASLMFASGADVKQVQMRLGHANVQTTLNIYTHITQDSARQTVDSFAKYMEK